MDFSWFQGRRVSSVRVVAVWALLLFVAACRGPAPADVVGSNAGGGRDWYCEPGSEGGWRCAANDGAAQRSVAEVAPTPPPPQDSSMRGANPAEGSSERESVPSPEPQPAPPVPAQPQQRSTPAELPLYRQLAHSLDDTPLLDLPASYYALQLFAAGTREGAEAVAVRSGLRGMAGARVERDGEVFHVLLVGVYASKERAEQALASLPASVRAMNPWVRRLGGLQEAMRRATGQE